MAGTIHIVFGEAGEIELRDALRQVGRDDRVLDFPDDLSFGPIAPPDPTVRATWVAETRFEDGWRAIVPEVEKFWADALSADERHIVWFSRRVTCDYAGFLEYLWHIDDRPCNLVDLTEVMVPVRDATGRVAKSRPARAIGFLESYQFIDGDLFSLAVPLGDEARAAYRGEWAKLREENTPLRIVTPALRLASVPLTYFDDALLQHVRTDFRKSAMIIGQVMSRAWDTEVYDVGDFFLSSRLIALAKAGVIESQGNLRRMTHSEVRLPPAAGKA